MGSYSLKWQCHKKERRGRVKKMLHIKRMKRQISMWFQTGSLTGGENSIMDIIWSVDIIDNRLLESMLNFCKLLTKLYSCKNMPFLPGMTQWHTLLIPKLRRQKQVYFLWFQGQPGLLSKFQHGQGCIVRLCPRKKLLSLGNTQNTHTHTHATLNVSGERKAHIKTRTKCLQVTL